MGGGREGEGRHDYFTDKSSYFTRTWGQQRNNRSNQVPRIQLVPKRNDRNKSQSLKVPMLKCGCLGVLGCRRVLWYMYTCIKVLCRRDGFFFLHTNPPWSLSVLVDFFFFRNCAGVARTLNLGTVWAPTIRYSVQVLPDRPSRSGGCIETYLCSHDAGGRGRKERPSRQVCIELCTDGLG